VFGVACAYDTLIRSKLKEKYSGVGQTQTVDPLRLERIAMEELDRAGLQIAKHWKWNIKQVEGVQMSAVTLFDVVGLAFTNGMWNIGSGNSGLGVLGLERGTRFGTYMCE
jgi:hypothetical protein